MTVFGLLATWFGSGKLRPMPGTWGTAAAYPFAIPIALVAGWWGLLLAAVALFALGVWVSERHSQELGLDDPGEIVIDEVVALWLTLVPLCFDWKIWLVAFFAFRAADIAKPWPASWCDRRLHGGLGIMADDVVAALYAAPATALIGWLLWDQTCFPWN